MSDDKSDYLGSHKHRRHTPGVPKAPEWDEYMQLPQKRLRQVRNRLPYCAKMDKAWVIMLHREGLVSTETARKLFPVLDKAGDERGWGGESWIKQQLDGDEDTASAVNYGRTLQEPMARMMMRDELLNVFDELLPALEAVLDVADRDADAIMAGHSHWAHAQPITYGAYLVAVHDGLRRGLDQLELAYRHTNENSGGCGACSGPGIPSDRHLITELLGFDKTIEPTYDCEASQDEMLTILFAASNIAITLSRTALDLNVWVTEEWNILDVAMEWRGVSSFMPQKANAGNTFERIRMATNEVLGNMNTCVFSFKNEPLQDVLPVYRADEYVIKGLGYLEQGLGWFRHCLPKVEPRRDRMWELLQDGYSGAPDLAIYLVREKEFGGRSAWRVCATMVHIARERDIPAAECTGELLDEAARICNDPQPHLTDEEVQENMSLEKFFDKHDGLGAPNPDETRRLVRQRRQRLQDARDRQSDKKQQLKEADEKLEAAVREIME